MDIHLRSPSGHLPQEEPQGGVVLGHPEPELVGHGLELELLLAELAAERRPVLLARLLREELGEVSLRVPVARLHHAVDHVVGLPVAAGAGHLLQEAHLHLLALVLLVAPVVPQPLNGCPAKCKEFLITDSSLMKLNEGYVYAFKISRIEQLSIHIGLV